MPTQQEKDILKGKRELAKVERDKKAATELARMVAFSPSTKDLQKAILTLFAEKNFNPVAELVNLAQSGALDPKDQIAVLRALSEYFPKPKTIEITGSVDHTVTFNVMNFRPSALDQPDGKRYSPSDYKDI